MHYYALILYDKYYYTEKVHMGFTSYKEAYRFWKRWCKSLGFKLVDGFTRCFDKHASIYEYDLVVVEDTNI